MLLHAQPTRHPHDNNKTFWGHPPHAHCCHINCRSPLHEETHHCLPSLISIPSRLLPSLTLLLILCTLYSRVSFLLSCAVRLETRFLVVAWAFTKDFSTYSHRTVKTFPPRIDPSEQSIAILLFLGHVERQLRIIVRTQNEVLPFQPLQCSSLIFLITCLSFHRHRFFYFILVYHQDLCQLHWIARRIFRIIRIYDW